MLKFNKNQINYREEDFGGLIINIKTGKIFNLNKIGYRIFLDLHHDIDIEKLIKKVQKEFKKTNKDQIKADIENFIKDLIIKGFASEK